MDGPRLYKEVRVGEDGVVTVVGYAYGEPWVEQALYMGDLRFDTEEEARDWWNKIHG